MRAPRCIILSGLTIPLGGIEFTASGSMGLALYPQDGLDPESLLKHADDAMYRAKQQGRNNYQLYRTATNDADIE